MGGGAIRSAAKVAGIAAATGGIRSIASEHLTFSGVRMASSGRPMVATVDDVKLVASNLESRPCVAFDDWVSVNDELEIDASEALPRVVFGGPPTLQEAKAATSELSIALEKTFLSPSKSIGYESSNVENEGSSLCFSKIEDIEKEACVTTAPSLPAPAIRAFKLLHESSMAKDVVASIASDLNVWTAVLQNKDLQSFLESERACFACAGSNYSMEYVGDCDANSADENAESSGFSDILFKIRSGVVNMLSSLSDYFKDLFGGKPDAIMEQSFMGLAVMAILVILLKRA